MALEKVVYTAHAVATGGREGTAKTDDGHLDVRLGLPKQMGGKDDGTNPEQLFAAGYAACFIGAMKFVAQQQKITLSDPDNLRIDSSVSFGPLANGGKGFGIAVDLKVHVPGLDHAAAEKLVHDAHEVCPYSNATRNNIDVTLSVA